MTMEQMKQEQFEEYLKKNTEHVRREGKELLAGVHQPKTDFEKRHKIEFFGDIVRCANKDEEALYQFVHQRVDGVLTEGYIPVNFLSCLQVTDGEHIFLAIRKGQRGPEYQVMHQTKSNLVVEWGPDLDTQWSQALGHFERTALLSEDSLDYCDADPFALFGIDDPITQRALRELERQPYLLCKEGRPKMGEWLEYVGLDYVTHPEDEKCQWVVDAFADCELPTPWTSYKGIGSIVVYANNKTGETTWRHPFYDYFLQLIDFCKRPTTRPIDVMHIRINRLLWSYEAQSSHNAEPLVSPATVEQLALILGHDLEREPYVVRSLKMYLKIFAHNYRQSEDVGFTEVEACKECLLQDREKADVMRQSWHETLNERFSFNLAGLSDGNVACIECREKAMSFCLECKDYMCLNCFDRLHQKGQRKLHIPFRLIPCAMCHSVPAKLHCTFTDKALCHECYALKHIHTLPKDARENPPKRIDYAKQQAAAVKEAQAREATLHNTAVNAEEDDASDSGSEATVGSVLGIDWHPFFDMKGIKYFYNFATGERMRRSPASVQNDTPLQQALQTATGVKTSGTQLTLEPRNIRPPHRTNPFAVSA